MVVTERIFTENFPHLLIPQPFLIKMYDGGGAYRPDFYCPFNGSIYEVSTTKAYSHISEGHLGAALEIAPVFIVEIDFNLKKINIAKYVHEGWVIVPRHLQIGDKEDFLLKELRKYPTKGGNQKILDHLNWRKKGKLSDKY